MPTANISMHNRVLAEQFALGPLRFTGADRFPLEEIYCNVEKDHIVLRLSGGVEVGSPWSGNSMVVFFLYRLPDADAAYRDEVASYREDASKKTVKLPEKRPFDQTVLEFDGITNIWQRDCFAVGPRNVFQLYESHAAGVMVRWSSQRGTLLDHPLFQVVRDSVRLVDGPWETELPPTRQLESGEAGDDLEIDDEWITNIDLRREQKRVRGYVQQRVSSYAQQENLGPGEAADPIRLITLGFYAEQSGYVALIFDTRREAEVDGSWTTFLQDGETILDVPEWRRLYAAFCEGQTITITDHNGRRQTIQDNDDDEAVNAFFGEMLTALMLELRNDGTLAELPLHRDAFFVVEEFDGRYSWPTFETRKSEGALGVKT